MWKPALRGLIRWFKTTRTPGGLARALSKPGYCSRTRAAELIRAGRVQLNGRVANDPETPVRMSRDRIEADGKGVTAEQGRYLILNKPRGALTTAFDGQGRETVYAYVPDGPFVAPVGRLDKASEGLLLFTNDSEWGARVTAPETHLEKTYHVQVAGEVTPGMRDAMVEGVRASDGEQLFRGYSTEWAEEHLARRGARRRKNRQIRRMLEALGMKVLRLVRVAIRWNRRAGERGSPHADASRKSCWTEL